MKVAGTKSNHRHYKSGKIEYFYDHSSTVDHRRIVNTLILIFMLSTSRVFRFGYRTFEHKHTFNYLLICKIYLHKISYITYF